MKKTEVFVASNEGISNALAFIRTFVGQHKVSKDECMRAEWMAEEAMVSLMFHAQKEKDIRVTAKSFAGAVSLEIECEGEKFDFTHSVKSTPQDTDKKGDDIQEAVSEILLRTYADGLKYRHQNGKNYISVKIVRSRHAALYRSLGALVIALLLGMLLNNTGNPAFNTALNDYFLVPVKNMFLNALKTVVAPVVFLSISTSIMRFSNLSEFGKIGAKIIASYMCTTLFAVVIGLGVFYLISPGEKMTGGIVAESAVTAAVPEEKALGDIMLDTVTGVVPENGIKPFLESNMLQLIFMAVIFGIAVGAVGKYAVVLKELLESLNEVFLKITTMLMAVMPIAVFCSVTSLILTLGSGVLISLLGMIGTFLLGLVCMVVLYCLLLLLVGRINPVVFLKIYFPTMLQVFSIASSNASIPVNMEACEKKLGIDKRIYSFSIPFGATVNMDGTCILLSVFTLTMARFYGIDVPGAAIVSLAISIILFSIGAPGAPGGMIIIHAALFAQIGVPQDALGIVMCLGPILGTFLTMTNCLGDVVVTTIVAKSEGGCKALSK